MGFSGKMVVEGVGDWRETGVWWWRERERSGVMVGCCCVVCHHWLNCAQISLDGIKFVIVSMQTVDEDGCERRRVNGRERWEGAVRRECWCEGWEPTIWCLSLQLTTCHLVTFTPQVELLPRPEFVEKVVVADLAVSWNHVSEVCLRMTHFHFCTFCGFSAVWFTFIHKRAFLQSHDVLFKRLHDFEPIMQTGQLGHPLRDKRFSCGSPHRGCAQCGGFWGFYVNLWVVTGEVGHCTVCGGMKWWRV